MIYKIVHYKLEIQYHVHHLKPLKTWVNSGAPEG